MITDNQLLLEVRGLLRSGIYNPNEIFERVYRTKKGVHYSRVRDAIQRAKCA